YVRQAGVRLLLFEEPADTVLHPKCRADRRPAGVQVAIPGLAVPRGHSLEPAPSPDGTAEQPADDDRDGVVEEDNGARPRPGDVRDRSEVPREHPAVVDSRAIDELPEDGLGRLFPAGAPEQLVDVEVGKVELGGESQTECALAGTGVADHQEAASGV